MTTTDLSATLRDYEPLLVLIMVLAAYTLGRLHEWLRQDKRRQKEDRIREQQHRQYFQRVGGLNCHALPALLALTGADMACGFFCLLAGVVVAFLGLCLWCLFHERPHDDDVWADDPENRQP